MPYSVDDKDKLPENVKKLPEKMQRQWIAVWNKTYEESMKEGGSEKDCEAKAFAMANGVIKKSQDGEDKGEDKAWEGELGFVFVELSDSNNKAFDCMVPGSFVDMHGRGITISQADMATFAANTKDAIEHTKSESGEVVGLPIDARNHDKGDGAGWIKDVYLQQVDKPGGRELTVLRVVPEWTEVGIDLISKRIRRMFSPTVNLSDKVIMGGTLTNWPATRDGKGRVLLRPIELEMSMFSLDTGSPTGMPDTKNSDGGEVMAGNDDKKDGAVLDKDALLAEVREITRAELVAVLAEFTKKPGADADGEKLGPEAGFLQLLDLEGAKKDVVEAFKATMLEQEKKMREEAAREAATMVASIRRDANIAEFSHNAVSGSADWALGLPVEEGKLIEFCRSLNSDQYAFFSGMVGHVLKQGLVSYAELGHDKQLKGNVPLPEYYAAKLDAEEISIKDLHNPLLSPDLGDLAQYDLTKWQK